jgi:hypothetical protein
MMKVLSFLKVIGALSMMLVIYAGMLLTMMAAAMDLGFASTAWDHVPQGWHIRVFGWNGLLVVNALCTFIVSGYFFFRMFHPPFIKRDHQ